MTNILTRRQEGEEAMRRLLQALLCLMSGHPCRETVTTTEELPNGVTKTTRITTCDDCHRVLRSR